jgi:hypothetical protein
MAVVGGCWAAVPAFAQDALDAGGLTFRDFAIADNGASLNRTDQMSAGGPNDVPSRVVAVEAVNGLVRIRFDSVKVSMALPLGWQATEDWERGVGYSRDRRYRLIVWRLDFAFEGVQDAEHYAATKSGAIKARRPNIQSQARKLGDGTFLVVYENVRPGQGDGGNPRVVFDLITPKPGNPKEGVLMTLGLPATDGPRGLKLLALLKSEIKIEW